MVRNCSKPPNSGFDNEIEVNADEKVDGVTINQDISEENQFVAGKELT